MDKIIGPLLDAIGQVKEPLTFFAFLAVVLLVIITNQRGADALKRRFGLTRQQYFRLTIFVVMILFSVATLFLIFSRDAVTGPDLYVLIGAAVALSVLLIGLAAWLMKDKPIKSPLETKLRGNVYWADDSNGYEGIVGATLTLVGYGSRNWTTSANGYFEMNILDPRYREKAHKVTIEVPGIVKPVMRVLKKREGNIVRVPRPPSSQSKIDYVPQPKVPVYRGSKPKASKPVDPDIFTLVGLVRNPSVKAAMTAETNIRSDIGRVREQIAIVSSYKAIHDELHDLQHACYRQISSEENALPEDKGAIVRLSGYHQTLKSFISQLRHIIAESGLDKAKFDWIQDLDKASEKLEKAYKNNDKEQLREAIMALYQVLDSRPGRIDHDLNNAAHALKLSGFVCQMMKMHRKLEQDNLAAEITNQFKAGVSKLQALDTKHARLVNEHDKWQEIDTELRVMEPSRMRLDSFKRSLAGVTKMIEPLCHDRTEDWVGRLEVHRQNLESAIANNDEYAIESHFRTFHWEAAEHFRQVDRDLKGLCDILSEINEQVLTPIAKEIGGG